MGVSMARRVRGMFSLKATGPAVGERSGVWSNFCATK